jgi:hypothetical protein
MEGAGYNRADMHGQLKMGGMGGGFGVAARCGNYPSRCPGRSHHGRGPALGMAQGAGHYRRMLGRNARRCGLAPVASRLSLLSPVDVDIQILLVIEAPAPPFLL